MTGGYDIPESCPTPAAALGRVLTAIWIQRITAFAALQTFNSAYRTAALGTLQSLMTGRCAGGLNHPTKYNATRSVVHVATPVPKNRHPLSIPGNLSSWHTQEPASHRHRAWQFAGGLVVAARHSGPVRGDEQLIQGYREPPWRLRF